MEKNVENKIWLDKIITVFSTIKSIRQSKIHPTGPIEEYAENRAVYNMLEYHIEPILDALYSENYDELKSLLNEFSLHEIHKNK